MFHLNYKSHAIAVVGIIFPLSVFANDIITPARQVIERLTGTTAANINFEVLPQHEDKDGYGVSCSNGKLTLKGSSATAFTYAFYRYAKQACHKMASWSGSTLHLPDQFAESDIPVTYSPYQFRYFLNVCTFGYTTPYWDWKRWEKEIDLMALHGINMPLANVATEAIAERVWKKMGLTDEDIRKFFTGPAYLPWHRMGNLNTWDGPLSANWHSQQIALQHKILERMRLLGMHPITPAFAGFVPEGFVKLHPEVHVKHFEWGGFDKSFNAYMLPPDSPYFLQIGKLFIEEWEKEFGKNTYYLSDSFNEMELPINPNDTDSKYRLLSKYGEAIYQSIAAGNPDAVWVTQGWTFGYQHQFWDKQSLQALLERVPDDKLIIIDLANDYPKWVWKTEQTWKTHKGFYGKRWILSYVPNFGGKTLLTGDLNLYASCSAEAWTDIDRGKLIGFGSAPEGLENNEVVYELLADMGWQKRPIDLDHWLTDYCRSRYGSCPEALKKAWKELCRSVYSSLYSYPRFTWQTVVSDTLRISKYDLNDTFFRAVEDFLSCAPQLKEQPLYRSDALLFAAQYIGAKADKMYRKALDAKNMGKQTRAKQLVDKTIQLLLQADRLLASHPTDRLSRWVEAAKTTAMTQKEHIQYETDAKRLITTWGGIQQDYAARYWSGLIKDYYVPRIKLFFAGSNKEELNKWEENWLRQPYDSNDEKPFNDPLTTARELIYSLRPG